MSEGAVVAVRLYPATAERPCELARSTRRSRSWLAAEAIGAHVELNACQIVEAGLAELDAGQGIGGGGRGAPRPARAVRLVYAPRSCARLREMVVTVLHAAQGWPEALS